MSRVKEKIEALEKRRLALVSAFISNRTSMSEFIEEHYKISMNISGLRVPI